MFWLFVALFILILITSIFVTLFYLPLKLNTQNLVSSLKKGLPNSLPIPIPFSKSPTAAAAATTVAANATIIKHDLGVNIDTPINSIDKPLPFPKSGYCYIGTDRGFRSCIRVGENNTCMSGDIFPSMDVCVQGVTNP
jgi:hypothetical protein